MELSNEGLGAREIAKKLGYKHQASVFKVLRKLGADKHLSYKVDSSELDKRIVKPERLRYAAEHMARFYMSAVGVNFLVPSSDAPYDLLVEFDGIFQKVQIKSSSFTNECANYQFALVRTSMTILTLNLIHTSVHFMRIVTWLFRLIIFRATQSHCTNCCHITTNNK